MVKAFGFAVLATVLLVLHADAAAPDYCKDVPPGTTLELNCQTTVTVNQSAAMLDKHYRQLLRQVNPTARRHLAEAYTSFHAYQKALCGYIYDENIDGSIRNFMFLQCEDRMNRDFSAYLSSQARHQLPHFHGKEGIW